MYMMYMCVCSCVSCVVAGSVLYRGDVLSATVLYRTPNCDVPDIAILSVDVSCRPSDVLDLNRCLNVKVREVRPACMTTCDMINYIHFMSFGCIHTCMDCFLIPL